MPAYTFEALDAQGATQKGLIDADTARAARSMLRARALVPLLVEPAMGATGATASRGLNITLWGGRAFSATTLAVWTRQLAGLVSAGLPLERALAALTEEAEDEKQRNLMASLRSEVNGGSPFARALSQHPREFSPIYTGVIAAGEQSGLLGTVLERLADDLEAREALKNKIVAASLYPAIVTLVAIVIVVFLVSYVVPQVANVFAGSKRALPFLTVVMLGLSDFVRSYGWLMLGMLVAGVGGVVFARRNEACGCHGFRWLRLRWWRLAGLTRASRQAGHAGGGGCPSARAADAQRNSTRPCARRTGHSGAVREARRWLPGSNKTFSVARVMFARL